MTTPTAYINTVKERMKFLEVTTRDICRITGWSMRTLRRRFGDPDSITLGEKLAIDSYLSIK